MKRFTAVAVGLLAAGCFVAGAGATIIGENPPPGTPGPFIDDGINCECTKTFSANTPFHFRHGFGQPANLSHKGAFGFSLTVNGVPLAATTTQTLTLPSPPGPAFQFLFWYYDFPNGLPAGTYTLHGVWTAPCEAAIADYGFAGTCSKGEPVVVKDKTGLLNIS